MMKKIILTLFVFLIIVVNVGAQEDELVDDSVGTFNHDQGPTGISEGDVLSGVMFVTGSSYEAFYMAQVLSVDGNSATIGPISTTQFTNYISPNLNPGDVSAVQSLVNNQIMYAFYDPSTNILDLYNDDYSTAFSNIIEGSPQLTLGGVGSSLILSNIVGLDSTISGTLPSQTDNIGFGSFASVTGTTTGGSVGNGWSFADEGTFIGTENAIPEFSSVGIILALVIISAGALLVIRRK